MSEMTINQIREARAKTEEQIGAALLKLCQETGLSVRDVRLRSTMVSDLTVRGSRVVSVDATIVLEDL